MAHYGMLRDYRFSDGVDDVRSATLYGPNDDKLGTIDDVIFDHATAVIQYAVVDTGGWLSSRKFLVPAAGIRSSANHPDDFAIDISRKQIEALPKYDENAVRSEAAWNDYDRRHREAWAGGPVLHKEGSTHTITPEAGQMPPAVGSGAGDQAYTPDRLAGKFPAVGPEPGKLRMRPSGLAARAEDSRLPGTFQPQDKPTLAAEEAEDLEASSPAEAQRDHLTNPDDIYHSGLERHARLAAFEDHLRRNRVDITASCRSCGTAKDRVA
ncbi:MAG TPA: PRC-barrel domain-containing protein [Candidatus Binatia bacterium]|nr:PRC-barrel domain-containing protein [Candidatus Binatia bacterium]